MVSHNYKYDPEPGHVGLHLVPASDEVLDIPSYDYYIHQSASTSYQPDYSRKDNNGNDDTNQASSDEDEPIDMFGPYEPVE